MTPHTIRYVAATEPEAREGAAALERASKSLSAEPVTCEAATDSDRLAPADCVVFAETPTTAAGSVLLEVIDACDGVPLVLFTDSTFPPGTARSIEGVAGYVRSDAADAVAHLADEVVWISQRQIADDDGGDGDAAKDGGTTDGADDLARCVTAPDDESRAEDGPESDDVIVAEPAAGPTDAVDSAAPRALEDAARIVAAADVDEAIERALEVVRATFEVDRCLVCRPGEGADDVEYVTSGPATDSERDADGDGTYSSRPVLDAAGTPIGASEPTVLEDATAGSAVRVPDGVRSVAAVPIAAFGSADGDRDENGGGRSEPGVLQAVDAEPNALDERDREHLESFARLLESTIGRLEARDEAASARDALAADLEAVRTDLEAARDDREALREEWDALAAQRDAFRALFERHPDPTVRYALEDGARVVTDANGAFEATFGVDRDGIEGTPPADVPIGSDGDEFPLLERLEAGERRRIERRLETVDGVRTFRITAVGVGDGDERSGNGGRTGLIRYRDVTRANRLERKLEAAEVRLEGVTSGIDDLQAPLNVARGFLELLEATGDAEHFAEVDAALEELRERLVDVRADADVGEPFVDAEPTALGDVARRAWNALDTGDAELVAEEGEVRLEADETRLVELLERVFRLTLDDGRGGDDGSHTVTVGTTDDGFYVARSGSKAGSASGSGGERWDGDGTGGSAGAADEAAVHLEVVDRIADAHGWSVGVADGDGAAAFAFRGVERTERGEREAREKRDERDERDRHEAQDERDERVERDETGGDVSEWIWNE
ncbi:GAF domain-containing protein [Natrialbaceae archaeon GCM10025810]|uniref:GAF domain-containing protein n=1 Tax=Halovalidus salilacus TaxID=3075124 RepID=UPI003609C4F7